MTRNCYIYLKSMLDMANKNHKTKENKEINIYSKEFKDKLKNLVENRNFKREILFNGVCEDYNLLSYEEQEKLSRKFKSFVNENIISLMNSEVEYILNKSYEDSEVPFSWDDVQNLKYYDYARIINDILDAFDNIINDSTKSHEEILTDLDEFLSFISDNFAEFETFDKTRKELEIFLNGLCPQDLKWLVEQHNNDLLIEYLEEYEEQAEVYQWFSVSSLLCEELESMGEVVINSHNYWGRTCLGQSVELDIVIQDIFLNWWCK